MKDGYDELGSLTVVGVASLQEYTSFRLRTLSPTSYEARYLGDIALALHDLHALLTANAQAPKTPASDLTISDLRKSLKVIAASVAAAQDAVEAAEYLPTPEPMNITET